MAGDKSGWKKPSAKVAISNRDAPNDTRFTKTKPKSFSRVPPAFPTNRIGFGVIPDIVGGLAKAGGDKLAQGVNAAAQGSHSLLRPTGGQTGLTSTGRGDYSPTDYRRDFESASDAALGKSLTNLGLHGDRPRTWGEAAGLGVGLAGVLPVGRGVGVIGRAITEVPRLHPAEITDVATKAFRNYKIAHPGGELTPFEALGITQRIHANAATGGNASIDDILFSGVTGRAHGPSEREFAEQAVRALSRKYGWSSRLLGETGTLDISKFGGGVAKRADVLGPRTLAETVQEASKGAREARAAQEAGYSAERSARARKGGEAYKAAGGGSEGVRAALGELSGALPKIEFAGFKELTPEALDHMVRHIWDESDLRFYEKLRTSLALQKATQGVTPQNSELNLIERVFGKANRDALADPQNIGIMAKMKHYGLDLWNLPRSVLASFDLSAPFRQGLVLGMRHPVIFKRNFLPMWKAFKKDEASLAVMEDISSRPNVPLYLKAKLAITETHGAKALNREEAFPSSMADRIPGVKASGRGYTVFLNKMRADVFDRMIDAAKAADKDVTDPVYLKSLGVFINSATGRGVLPGKAEDAAVFLNSFMFSPRLLASRVNLLNPHYYYKLHPDVRVEAIKASAATAGSILTFLGLASQIPGWSVGLDPRSANFGKIRIRNTRLDVAGGFLPVLVLYSRLFKGESISSSSGKKMNLSGGFGESSRWDVAQRFIESKMGPSPGLVRDLAKGKTFLGDPVTFGGEAKSLLVPLNVQGALDTYNTEGSVPAALGAAGLGSVGFGVGSYGDTPAKKSAVKSAKPKWSKTGSSTPAGDKSKWSKP